MVVVPRVRCSWPELPRVNSAPNSTNSKTRAGPSRHTASTALRSKKYFTYTCSTYLSQQQCGRKKLLLGCLSARVCVAPYIVEETPRNDGITDVILHTVCCIEDCTHTTLCILCAAILGILLRNDGNAAEGCHLEGICQTSNATTKNKEVILQGACRAAFNSS